MNETKQNEIQPRPKGCVQKIFQTLLPNFHNFHDLSCQTKILSILHGKFSFASLIFAAKCRLCGVPFHNCSLVRSLSDFAIS